MSIDTDENTRILSQVHYKSPELKPRSRFYPVEIDGSFYNPRNLKDPLISEKVKLDSWSLLVWKEYYSEEPYVRRVMIVNHDPIVEEENPVPGGSYVHPIRETDSPKVLLPKSWEKAVKFINSESGAPLLDIISSKYGWAENEITESHIAAYVTAHELSHAKLSKGITRSEFDIEIKKQTANLPSRNLNEFLSKHPNANEVEIVEFLLKYKAIPREEEADKVASDFIKRHLTLFS